MNIPSGGVDALNDLRVGRGKIVVIIIIRIAQDTKGKGDHDRC